MKKYLIGILMLGILLFALCGCGGTPLAKAYDSISALAEKGTDNMDNSYQPSLWNVQFDEENDVLSLYIDNGADIDPIFEALNKAIDGQDVGTLMFYLDGTRGDDWEKALDQKLSELSCKSIERLGLNFSIVDYSTHKWTALGEKTEKLYLDTNCNVFWDYSDAELKALSKIKDVQLALDGSSMRINGISKLSGIETLSFVPAFTFETPGTEESQDPLAAVTEDNPYLNGGNTDGEDAAAAEADSTEASTDESEEAAAAVIPFDYFASSDDGVWNLGDMDNLKTLLIYPVSG